MPHKVNGDVHLTTMTCFWRPLFHFTRSSWQVMPPFFLFRALYKLDMWKFYIISLQHCWRHSYISVYTPSLSALFFHLWTRAILAGKFALPRLHPEMHCVLHCPFIGLIVSSQAVSKGQTVVNLMVWPISWSWPGIFSSFYHPFVFPQWARCLILRNLALSFHISSSHLFVSCLMDLVSPVFATHIRFGILLNFLTTCPAQCNIFPFNMRVD